MNGNKSVLVIEGGVAGIQASLDLAEQDFKVYLVEKTSSIGGRMAQLDKTFPTNDCSICIGSNNSIQSITSRQKQSQPFQSQTINTNTPLMKPC